MSQVKDQLDVQASIVRPGSPALNQLQQEIAFLQRKQDALRELLTPRVIERLKSADGETDMDRQKAILMRRATAQQLIDQVQQAEEAYQKGLVEYCELGGSSGDLEARMAELVDLRKDLQRIRSEIDALESGHGLAPTR